LGLKFGRLPPSGIGNKEATMNKILTGALAALTVGGAMAATAVPAAAQPHGGYHGGGHYGGGHYGGYRGGYGYGYGGGAAAAAIIGLAAGAALTGGYAPSYYAPSYYAPGYYATPRCRMEMRWNPNWGGYDRVRVCY
jgi:hypothetical protein